MRDSSSGRLDIPQPKIVMFYIFSITDESHERKRFFLLEEGRSLCAGTGHASLRRRRIREQIRHASIVDKVNRLQHFINELFFHRQPFVNADRDVFLLRFVPLVEGDGKLFLAKVELDDEHVQLARAFKHKIELSFGRARDRAEQRLAFRCKTHPSTFVFQRAQRIGETGRGDRFQPHGKRIFHFLNIDVVHFLGVFLPVSFTNDKIGKIDVHLDPLFLVRNFPFLTNCTMSFLDKKDVERRNHGQIRSDLETKIEMSEKGTTIDSMLFYL